MDVVTTGTVRSRFTPPYVCPLASLVNPYISGNSQMMPNLSCLRIHIPTASVSHLEQFLTYAVSYVGQKRLKQHVDVELFGNPEALHPNIRNNLTNLCRNISIHKADEM